MPSLAQRRFALSAGEECTVVGNGLVQVTLVSGVLDIAGVVLQANRPYSFFLNADRRSLVLFTLEGGSGVVASEAPAKLIKSATTAAPLVQLTRRTLLSLPSSKVLVIGRPQGGKTLAAHTICNLLLRHGAEDGTGILGPVFLMDLNAESNSVYGPGCLSLVQIPELPLWLGGTANPALLPISFYTGQATRPASKDAGAFLSMAEQLHETSEAFVREQCGPGNRFHLVMDAPAPLPDLKAGVFYKKLIEVLRPSHVVVMGSKEEESDSWSNFLQEDVQRTLPDCNFVFVSPVAKACATHAGPLHLQEYFVGTPLSSLGCSKVVVPLQALQFVELLRDEGSAVTARKTQPNASWHSLVCALSHAELLEEVALAPIAGLLIVSHIDEENDEAVLIVPTQGDPLLRSFVIIPCEDDRETLRLTEAQVAMTEEVVVY